VSVDFGVEVRERFTVAALLERTRGLTGLGDRLVMLLITPDVVHDGAAPGLASAELLDSFPGPGVVLPRGFLRLASGDGVADLSWTEIDDQLWMTASATWRNDASTLLAAYSSIAAAQLGRSVVDDEDSLLGRGGLVDPDSLLDEIRRAAGAALVAGPIGSERNAAVILAAVRRAAT
jgi:hypothetical protein